MPWFGSRWIRAPVAALAVMLVAGPPVRTEGGDREEGERPSDWFYRQRAYPRRTFPAGALQRVMDEIRRERYKSGRYVADPELTWVALGPAPIAEGQTFGTPAGPVSGRVSVIALDPRYDGVTNQTVYLGAALGGLWRSDDNGAHWSPLTDDQPSMAIGAIAIDPWNPDIIYAGTGEPHNAGDSYYGAGLLKSTDGGKTWTVITGGGPEPDSQTPPFINAAFSALAMDPSNPSTLYATTQRGRASSATSLATTATSLTRGLWKSTDAGVTWKLINPEGLNGDSSASDVVLDPGDPNRIFVAYYGKGIYLSATGGESGSWQKLAGGLPDAGFVRIKLASGPPVSGSGITAVYAAFATTGGDLLGIYQSVDGGSNWSRLNGPQTPGQANYNLALAVDPFDARIVYYGTQANTVNTSGTLWRSLDGGKSWTDLSRGDGVTGGLHADTHWIAISPARRETLFTANDGGVWRTDNATSDRVSWTNLNSTLNITQFYTIALHPSDPGILIGGTQDNGTDSYLGEMAWRLTRGGDGGATLIDQSNPETIYHTFQNFNNCEGRASFGPEVSTNGGRTWTRRGCFNCAVRAGGLHPADRMSELAPMALHPGFTADGNVVYFGTHRLYRSNDKGVTWIGLGPSDDGFGASLTAAPPAAESCDTWPYFITAIAASPVLDRTSDPPGETVWVGTGDGRVQVTRNAGALGSAVFVDVTKPPLPNRYITDLAVDPGDPRRAVVTFSGFNELTPDTPGHVFLTEDLGATWADVSQGLPDLPVNSIAFDPLVPGTFFLGTDVGVFYTSDGGANWKRLGSGMPLIPVLMLRHHAASRSLIAATHGRGVFRLTLPAPTAGDAPTGVRRRM